MDTLPAALPNISGARLPATYEAAKTALANCERIDECQEWANKAEALASYAKQADDDTLRKLADRIQARAVRRAGELLKTFDGRGGDRTKNDGADTFGRRDAGYEAGMSERQQVTAVRVANVPEDEFNGAVESDSPPTVTALAEQGKQSRPLVDLQDRDPADFSLSTEAQGHLRRLAIFAGETDPATIARGALPHEHQAIRRNIHAIDHWLDRLFVQLEE